ncbi:Uncharacterised protein [Avibacterium paragallinarum]|uniref:Uncharacterized protein n=1 Tax=Avibacterium paragallinarum TaxID=728 RepID=A0A377IAI2_AVIPA|nr:Uncharacterised protein [Avibacterium paragallinarum]
MMNEQTYCGIDVAKRHFVIGLQGKERWENSSFFHRSLSE